MTAAVGCHVPTSFGVLDGLALLVLAGAGLRCLEGGRVDDVDPAFGDDDVLGLQLAVDLA